MPEVQVNSWNELQDRLFQDSWQPEIKRFRSPYVFRGQSRADDRLVTSLMRLGGNYPELEQHLLRNFRKYAHQDIVEKDTIWHWLSLAQHHGLPTRLLDWSVSPFVAAHFATVNVHEDNQNAAVWAVNQKKAQAYLPDQLREGLEAEGADYFTVEILSKAVDSLADLDALEPPNFVLFFEPPSMDARIINQYALFSLMPDPQAALDDWLEDHPDLWLKIVIPAELKWEVRDKLDQINISERVLFPGLDGLSQWQKRYYTPRT